MHELAIQATAVAPASELQLSLFDDFINFVDRSAQTTRTYITNLKQFIAWLHYSSITSPQRADIIAYRDYLAAEHIAISICTNSARGWQYRTDKTGKTYTIKCKPNTVKLYLQSVCAFFKWTAINGYYPNIAENIHAPKVRQDTHKKDALTAADVLAIENNITMRANQKQIAAAEQRKDTKGRCSRATEQGKRLFAMYTLAVNCGLRTIEISRANIKDLEIKNGITYLYVWGKGHTEADTKKTLAPAVSAALYDYLNSRTDARTGNSPLFVSTGNRSGGKRLASTTISTMLKTALVEAGYNSERLTAHSLRHTAGTNVQELTGNLYQTQQYMRHANPATTEIYLHIDTEKQETEIAQRLYNFYHGQTDEQATRSKLDNIVNSLNSSQLETLTSIAAAMAN